MIDIRTFDTGSLYSISVRDHSVRVGYKVVVLGNRYVNDGLVPNVMSAEGVSGTAQVMRFDSREKAQQWIDAFHEDYGYEEGRMYVAENRGSNQFIRMPVSNFEHDCWVNTMKWDRMTDNKKAELARLAPEYFSEDETIRPLRNIYRGFRF